MKKVRRCGFLLLTAVLMLCLCGCSRYKEPYENKYILEVASAGEAHAYSLYAQSMELSYDGTTYTYEINRSGNAITYTVYYPNGGSYYETRNGNTESSGWNDQYDIGTVYARGEKLVDILSQHYYISTLAPTAGHILIALVCLAVGGFSAFFPEAQWELSHMFRSWQYESVEPSEAGVIWTRFGGILCMILGVILFFINWS